MGSITLSQLALMGISCYLASVVFSKYRSLKRAMSALGDGPGGGIIWLHPVRAAANVLAPFFPFPGQIGFFHAKFSLYATYGSTCLGSVLFWGDVPTFWVSDAEVIKIVSSDRVTYRRDLEWYEVTSVYGPNIVGTDGPDWKRHRAVAKSAFNEANNALVWSQSTRLVNEWFSQIDTSADAKKVTRIHLLKDFTQLTLLVLFSAAFGRHASWTEDLVLEPQLSRHGMSFGPAVISAVQHLVPKVLTPHWLVKLAQYVRIPFVGSVLKETQDSFEALRFHMLDMILLAREWVSGGKTSLMDAALLRNLVEANVANQEEDKNGKRLTDDELLSNTFMFLLAGHETSAHSLCFSVLLLALYPDVQQKVYEEVLRLWPDGAPTAETTIAAAYRETLDQLKYTTAVFQETLRLFPPVTRLVKLVHVDTTLYPRRFEQSAEGKLSTVHEFSVPVTAGSMVVMDFLGLHMNPIHWGEDVAEFKPERFIDTESYRWPRDAFIAFSTGPRACIGERFAMTESLCILANIVRRYEIQIPEELKAKSHSEQKKLMLRWITRVTVTPTNSSVLFRRRD